MSVTASDRQAPKALFLLLSLSLVVLLGFIDYTTADLTFLVFDLMPILLATWFVGKWAGLLVSFASVTSWFLVDVLEAASHLHSVSHYWNAAVKLGFFAIVTQLIWALRQALLREKELARTDPLTGAANMRAFTEQVISELERVRRYGFALTLAYIDADNFKTVNDRLGHSAGDILLRKIVESLQSNLRANDTIARLGGDEFAILMPETDESSAMETVSRIQRILTGLMQENGWGVTFSIGVTTCVEPGLSVDQILRQVDAAMYSVKKLGKNNIKHMKARAPK
jgi:diguanylate cyclase (GGDEF)-like protein